MIKKDKQYTIYIRSTKESIPVNKEEFDAYYHDINIYRIRQQRHGRCVCPASKRLTCDMDCLTCPFHRMGDTRSLDYTETDDEGNETAWVDEIPDDSPLLEDIIIEASEMKALYARLTDLMPEAIKIGELRLEGLSEDAIGERIGIGRKTFAYRLKKSKPSSKKNSRIFLKKVSRIFSEMHFSCSWESVRSKTIPLLREVKTNERSKARCSEAGGRTR